MTKPRVDRSSVFEAAWQRSDTHFRAFLDSLANAFAVYVEQGRHDHFGRDEPLHWPSSARSAALKHIHVIPVDPERNRRLFKAWRLKDPFRRTSDRMLVYVKDDKGNYCLLPTFTTMPTPCLTRHPLLVISPTWQKSGSGRMARSQ
ncbi:hypothetical protein D9M68_700990 [compost metagenome]